MLCRKWRSQWRLTEGEMSELREWALLAFTPAARAACSCFAEPTDQSPAFSLPFPSARTLRRPQLPAQPVGSLRPPRIANERHRKYTRDACQALMSLCRGSALTADSGYLLPEDCRQRSQRGPSLTQPLTQRSSVSPDHDFCCSPSPLNEPSTPPSLRESSVLQEPLLQPINRHRQLRQPAHVVRHRLPA